MDNKKILITGLGAYVPTGYGAEESWNNVINHCSSVVRNDKWINKKIKNHYYGYPSKVPANKDIVWTEFFPPTRYSLLGLHACKTAIEDAKLDLNTCDNNIGMVIDTSMGSSFSVEEYLQDLYQRGLSKISPMKFTKTVTNTAIGDISRYFKLTGPSSLILNESSLCYGIDLIKRGVVDIIICGSIEHYTDFYVLSEQETDGLVNSEISLEDSISKSEKVEQRILGEGACFIVLETEESAKRRNARTYAEIIDYSTSFDPDNVESTTRRTEKCLKNNITNISDELNNYSNLFWISPYQTDIQKNQSEPRDLLNSLFDNLNYISHKEYTGDMGASSNMLGVLVAAKCLEEKTTTVSSDYQNDRTDLALVNTTQEGGGSSLFLLKK